jgi:ABC-type antimicrobial peptide transport system permease subunit
VKHNEVIDVTTKRFLAQSAISVTVMSLKKTLQASIIFFGAVSFPSLLISIIIVAFNKGSFIAPT